jgi:membrane-associated phospholipid phosphatase
MDLRRYHFVDYGTQAYLAIVGLVILFFHGDRLPEWWMHVVAHGAGMLALHLFIRAHAARPSNRVLTFFRVLYPIFIFGTIYQETGAVNRLLHDTYYDAPFIAFEDRLFGFQPVVRFMETFPSRAVAEVLYFAYFTYYLLVPAVGIALYVRNRRECFHYVSHIAFVFYMCYLTYIFFPVLGPTAIQIPEHAARVGISYIVPPFPESVQSAMFFHLMSYIHGNFQVIGAAFPSSHVAAASCAGVFAWAHLRRVRYVVLVDVFLIAVATVYCRYHYAVDVLGGFATTAVLMPLGEWLYRRVRRSLA